MRFLNTCVLIGFMALCMTAFTGCTARRVGAGMGPAFVEALSEAVLQPPLALAMAASDFREANQRWPKDYPELLEFARQSDGETYKALQSVSFDRVEFKETPDGGLEVNAEYALASGGTVRVEEMKIGPPETKTDL